MTLLPPCIYCRSQTNPRTSEHVLHACFGANLTLDRDVCGECNSSFSVPDRDLRDHVDMFGRGRPHFMSGIGFMDNEDAGVRTTVFVRLDGKGELIRQPPQAYRSAGRTWHLVGTAQRELDAFRDEVAKPGGNVQTRLEAQSDGLPVPLSIIRTAPRTFLVRGTDAGELARVEQELATIGIKMVLEGAPEASALFQPRLSAQVSFPIGSIGRALAKVSINYLCFLFGPALALRPELDPVRRFARFDDGLVFDHVVLKMMQGDSDGPDAFADVRRHALVVTEMQTAGGFRIAVSANIHGYPVGLVRFAETAERLLPAGTWRVSYFNHENGEVEHLKIPQDGLRCFANIEAVVPGATELARREAAARFRGL